MLYGGAVLGCQGLTGCRVSSNMRLGQSLRTKGRERVGDDFFR